MLPLRDSKSGLRGLGRPVRLFLSYAPRDEPYREELGRHLESLRRNDIIEVWHEGLVVAGEDQEYERRRRLEEADVILLLVSADYLAFHSAYAEMEAALARQQLGTTRVVALLLRPVSLEGLPVNRLQWLPRGGHPISLWPSRDEAWVDVVQGIRNVIDYSVTRSNSSPPPHPPPRPGAMPLSPATSLTARALPSPPAFELALPLTVPVRAPEPMRPTLPLGDIFRRGKQPDVTFVEPSQLKLLKVHLRTMGQGLVVEGPSGIGKTTAVNKAREAIAPAVPHRRVRSLVPGDLLLLDEALSSGFTGHLFIDDFHHLDEARMRNVASAIKVLADDSRDDAKITVIGINPVGVSLMHNFPDLAGRFDRVSMTRQPDPCIAELITRGETAANVTFLRRDELINAAAGSFFTAQQLCFHACVRAGIDETQPTPTEVDLGVHAVLDAVMDSLDNKYHDRLRNFSAWDRARGRPGAFLALLWLLSRDPEGFVSVVEAGLQFPKLDEAFAWLGAGNLESAFAGIPGLSELFYFNARAGVLTAEDPQLVFYLSHMSWTDFARRSGHAQVRLDPGGMLVFTGTGPVTGSFEAVSSIPPSSVLHLSDLHFGTLEQATLWCGQLAEDLRELDCARLDAVILSGDISNRAAPDEYDAAKALLAGLMAELDLPADRIILVPGNHDLSWPLAQDAYRLERREGHSGTLTDGLYIDRGEIVEVRSEEAYRRRFEPFSAFYGAVKGQPYPLEYAQQAILQHFPEQKLLFLGLNSAWQLDHHFKLRAAIHGGALSDALFRIRTTPEYAGCLKIAVWHHPISGDGDDRLRDTGFLEQLAKAGFRLALHGHVHQARNELFRYDMSAGDRRLDLVCAGTFGAPASQWVPGYPLGYNLLRFGRGKVIVETRRREELNGAWKPDARWLRGPGADPLPRYEIQL